MVDIEFTPANSSKSNFAVSDKHPSVSSVTPDQPVTHNATVSNTEHENVSQTDNLTKMPSPAKSNPENVLEAKDNENSFRNSDIPCPPNAEQQEES